MLTICRTASQVKHYSGSVVAVPGVRWARNVAVFRLTRMQQPFAGQVFPRDKLLAKLQPYRSALYQAWRGCDSQVPFPDRPPTLQQK